MRDVARIDAPAAQRPDVVDRAFAVDEESAGRLEVPPGERATAAGLVVEGREPCLKGSHGLAREDGTHMRAADDASGGCNCDGLVAAPRAPGATREPRSHGF